MTRWTQGSIRPRRFGLLLLLAAGALLVTASGPGSLPAGRSGPAPHIGQGKLLLQGGSMFVPAAAHVTGAAGTNWRTDLEVFNIDDVMAQYQIALLVLDQNNSSPATVGFDLFPGQSVRYNDALFSLFGFTGSAGLWITATSGQVAVSSRTYNQVPEGTYGQYIGAALESHAIQHGQEGRVIQLTHNTSNDTGFRTNVGFLNCTGMTITVLVDLYRWDGLLLGSRTYGLLPYMFTQKNRIFTQVTQDDVSDGYVVVRTLTPGGKFFAYASVVDNRTGDPIYIPAVVITGGAQPTPTPTPTSPGATFTPTYTPDVPTATPTNTPDVPTPTPTQPGPNLNLRPYTPSGWDAPLVASGVPGTHVYGGLVGNQTTYVDWALLNEGPADAVIPQGAAIVQVDLDGAAAVFWAFQTGDYILEAGFSVSVEDFEWEGISAGQHSLTMIGDPDEMIPETNEGDNTFTFNGTWANRKAGIPIPQGARVIDVRHLKKRPIPGFADGMMWGRTVEEIRWKRRLAGLRDHGPQTVHVAKSFAEPVYIPATAHVAGAAGTNWRTDLELHNPGDTQAQYEIALLLRNQANPNPTTVVYSVAPGGCLRLNDVLFSIFGFEGGAALRVTPMTGSCVVTSRTYNLTQVGTYGQFIGGAPVSQAIQFGQTAVLIQLNQNSEFRTNMGFVSAYFSSMLIRADMYRSDGTFLGTREYELGAFEHRQIDRIFERVTGSDVTDGYIVVSEIAPGGQFFAYASVVDNATGDPVYIPAIVIDGAGAPTPTPTYTNTPTATPTATPLSPMDCSDVYFTGVRLSSNGPGEDILWDFNNDTIYTGTLILTDFAWEKVWPSLYVNGFLYNDTEYYSGNDATPNTSTTNTHPVSATTSATIETDFEGTVPDSGPTAGAMSLRLEIRFDDALSTVCAITETYTISTPTPTVTPTVTLTPTITPTFTPSNTPNVPTATPTNTFVPPPTPTFTPTPP